MTVELKDSQPCFKNPHMQQFCKTECFFKKEDCQHICSLFAYQIKHTCYKIIGERPNCPKCNSDRSLSRGDRWYCGNCGNSWCKNKHPRKIIERPDNPCPSCKSIHVISNSNIWHCGNCGKHWIKHKVQRIFINRPDNPCPRCKSIHVRSAGAKWCCYDCGKSWVKIRQQKITISRPNNPCPECNSIHTISSGQLWCCADCGKTWLKHRRKLNTTDFAISSFSTVCEVKTF